MEAPLHFFLGRCRMFKKISDGTIKVAPLEGKKKIKKYINFGCTPPTN